MADTVRDAVVYVGDKNGTGISNINLVVWSGLDGDDTGEWVRMAKYSDKTIHIYAASSFGGATVTLEGSNELVPTGANAITLTDAQGNAISKTAAAIEQVLENPLWIRPKTSGGTGADIIVAVCGRRS